jgi:Spy/CpxP family protein refolding chaperone
MRQQRFLVLAMVAGALSVAPVAAQQSGPPHGPAARVLEHRKDLQLTDDQVKKLEALEKSQASMASRNDSLMRATRAEWDKARSDVMAVLTPPQRERVDSLRRHYRDQYGKGRDGKGHEGHKETHDSTPG